MKSMKDPQQNKQQLQDKRHPYETPAVIHESLITTRAGSSMGNPRDNGSIDPADLFGD